MEAPLLSVKDLSISFPFGESHRVAVEQLSFDIYKGKTLGIVGESGSGKSITCLSIMKLLQKAQHTGAILFEDQNLLNQSERELQKIRGNEISMVFQEPMSSLNPVHTCGKQVLEMLMQHQVISKKEAKARVLEWFEKVKLPHPTRVYAAYPHELSGGQKQRVMIAMAMITQPKLLIADEPTTALDVSVQAEILSLLKELQATHETSIIFITHDLAVVSSIADHVLVLYKGKKMEYATTNTLFQTPQHPYTKALIACRPTNKKGRLSTVEELMNGSKDESQRQQPPVTTAPTQKVILDIQELSKHYPLSKNILGKTTQTLKALDQINLQVMQGQTLGIVGESGSGKSTLGQCILQLTRPTQGKVFYEDQLLSMSNKKQLKNIRKEIQVVFQDPYSSLNPKISIGKAILEVMKVHKLYSSKKEGIKKVKELLEKVGLEREHYDRYPSEFSGGQRQRVCIARSLAVEPKVLICDESVSALDVSVQAMVLNLLNDLKATFNLTYLFISHDLSVVKYMSDYMIIMNKGKIVEQGIPEKIYDQPSSDYTKKLIAAIPTLS